jgi:DNA primase
VDAVSVVKQANDIVEVIGEYVALRRMGRTYKGLCPFHDDHHPSMDVDPGRQRFRCWSCGKYGDVITFVQEREHLDFREALQMLAQRARIQLPAWNGPQDNDGRAQMLDLMKWAEQEYHRYFLEAPQAEAARKYVQERGLSPETVEKYALGYAPNSWEWIAQRAFQAGWKPDLVAKAGLVSQREGAFTFYDRFRDRVMFPIRDVRGRVVGFGGRILPGSPAASNAPKYYNSTDTPLFTKSDHLYGLDRARDAGNKLGYLAVVEGYTDVLMAHQHGVLHVVATLGTALNERHIAQLKRYVQRVVLVFDADAGGYRGVDQALEQFVSNDLELAIATLPEGMDPCDLLVARGPQPFLDALENAVDALEFKLQQEMTSPAMSTVEGRRRALDHILSVLARVPAEASKDQQVKRELILGRVAQRIGLKEELLWERLGELRKTLPTLRNGRPQPTQASDSAPRSAPASPIERELLECLLAEPRLVSRAMDEVPAEALRHPGLRRLLEECYGLVRSGVPVNVDTLRFRLSDNRSLSEFVMVLQSRGQAIDNRSSWLEELLREFRRRQVASQADELKGRLRTMPSDGPPPIELLRQLQEKKV